MFRFEHTSSLWNDLQLTDLMILRRLWCPLVLLSRSWIALKPKRVLENI